MSGQPDCGGHCPELWDVLRASVEGAGPSSNAMSIEETFQKAVRA